MSLFSSTLNNIAFLFGFIAIGFVISKLKLLPEKSAAVLSKLENMLFIPASVLGTFSTNFTQDKLGSYSELLMISAIIEIVVIPLAIIIPKLITKDRYVQKIYTYGLSFSNFGFMGYAVVLSLFPEIYDSYLIFTLPLWIAIYLWGVPRLLIANSGQHQSFKESLKSFVNPMFVCMIIGMIIGISGIKLPNWTSKLISDSASCMSPVAMLLTGIVVSSISLKKTFTTIRTYVVSIIRLVIFPLAFLAIAHFVKLPEVAFLCALCSLAMPLGLNTIVIPSAFGKPTDDAAGMAVISHLLSAITIPLIFMLV
ncbi:MAG: AEC family transporter [Clostridia bacterium]|nr:AEC family transporter [Clostridia bacterium]